KTAKENSISIHLVIDSIMLKVYGEDEGEILKYCREREMYKDTSSYRRRIKSRCRLNRNN
ncbi:MAG: hypothetical protein ACK4F9_07830, partial [Brevinematia bacterium]